MTKAQKKEQAEAVTFLRERIKPGDTLYTVIRHVSASGMSRSISVLTMPRELLEAPWDISGFVGRALDMRRDERRGGVKIGGCGMDMGFQLVHQLGHALFPGGFECIGEKCPSSDHSNGDRNRQPHHHTSGGYAIRQSWI